MCKSIDFCRMSAMTTLKRRDICLPGSSTDIIMKFGQKVLENHRN